jgi:hypothetical protein
MCRRKGKIIFFDCFCLYIFIGGKYFNIELDSPGTGGYICNPSFLGGRDQEDNSLKPAPGK